MAEDDHQVLIDVIETAPDGSTHTYWSTHCRHGNHEACSADAMLGDVTYESGMAGSRLNFGKQVAIRRKPAQCKTCAAPCRCACHEGGTEPAVKTPETTPAAVFAQLRANLGSLTGTPVGRPHYGGEHLVYREGQIRAWLDEQEEIIGKEQRDA